ncbi:tetratricopeptide repeat protein [Aquabacterium sp.]|uniref:tetratricopeptide repeat protein n=1 Tax=Aquabacterium sp. TaxID=1872578 RepID=UPI00248A6D3C|nr:tetratricopeptide repeat protein [Aquabacterium sp.]MDI1260542.1 tetratricopeptide repeat protein [Aquabacterium sp.]
MMKPNFSRKTPDELHNEGIALYRSNRFDEALALYNAALALRPDFAGALNSRGFLHQDMGLMEEALKDFSQAVAVAPDMAMARLNLGMAQLKLGQFEAGWENYEARWMGAAEAHAGVISRPVHPLPVWSGEADTQGQRLLVITEQGFGDTFQFTRYLPLLAKRFAKVGFACAEATQRLMEWSFGDDVVTFTRMPVRAEAWRAWDVCCNMMSLPRAFGTSLATIPANAPYLRVPPVVASHWRERVEQAAPGRLRIGVAWAGRKEHQSDARRSLRFEQLAPLLADERVAWFSLQKWLPGEGLPAVSSSVDWFDWTDEADFADTAALVSQLDLVISIDSAMVHLAGGLGVPVWMLDRFDNEWRWLTGRTDSPWYPKLRIFRQASFGAWGGVLEQVKAALQALPTPRPMQARQAPLPTTMPKSSPPPKEPVGLTVEQALQAACLHQSAGRLPQAESLLRQVLQQQPGHVMALHLLGVVLYQAGQPGPGIELIAKAVNAKPEDALFRSNLAEMCRQQGRLDEAIRHGEQAIALAPTMASAWANLGIAYHDADQQVRARQCQERALQLDPHLLPALNNLGSIARALKDHRQAVDWYRKALAVQPAYLESLSNLGAVLLEGDDFESAAEPLERALKQRPDYPEALCNSGLLRIKQERFDEALHLLVRSLRLKPDYVEAMIGLALVWHEKDQLAEARRVLEKAVKLRPDKADAWVHLGTVCQEMGETQASEKAFLQALSVDPEHVSAITGLGNLQLERGRMDEAERLLKQAIAIDDQDLGARFHLIQLNKVKPGDDNVAHLEARLEAGAALSSTQLTSLHYALGKAYDDQCEWARAFPHFLEGARLKRSKFNHDPDQAERLIERVMQTVDADYIRRMSGHGSSSDLPVFVLGMPRSGTTLTEQIIASHPQAHGAGELHDLMAVLQRPVREGAAAFPEGLRDATPALLTAWGEDYVAGLRRRAPEARRITDKMPGNYIALGLIPLLMPHARIIHVKRNPVDTCVSCFTRLFNRHQEFTYDLTELGRHYVNYARLMDHWRAVMPAGSFMEVQYEDIVADMARQARRLIDFVGLPWDDACLSFHETKRSVRTASVTQVRQPIYTSSVQRWRHYEEFLGPLLTALGDVAPR